jgi:hypothetical protein
MILEAVVVDNASLSAAVYLFTAVVFFFLEGRRIP